MQTPLKHSNMNGLGPRLLQCETVGPARNCIIAAATDEINRARWCSETS